MKTGIAGYIISKNMTPEGGYFESDTGKEDPRAKVSSYEELGKQTIFGHSKPLG